MMLAATHALAELAREQVPDMVRGAYEESDISFGREYLIPKPFDHRVLFHLAPAVAKAAMETGIASLELDLDDYREQLRASLGPGREVMRWMTESARKSSAKIIFPEGHNDSVIQAVAQMAEDGICEPILLGRPPRVREKAKLLGVDLTGIEIVHAAACTERRYEFAETLFEQRARRGLTLAEAQWNLYKPVYFAASMLAAGEVDAMVAGIEVNYAEILRPVLQVIGKADGVSKVSGLYMLAFPGRELLLFADTTVNIDPGPETLRDIALQTATFAKHIGIRPRVAMVSFSNFSSNSHEESRQMAAAVELVREADPELEIDGEMQADTAIDEIKLREVYPFTRLTGPANILVFSRLSAANVAYKLLDRLGGADVIGPVLLGMAKPAHILQRGCSVQDIINLATVAAVDSQARNNQI
jgi:malate dehydrogenase (oxaloacetate-decarboxylating)(NADP+)